MTDGKRTGWAEIYRSADSQYRYRVVAANGEVISTPGESYTRKWSAKRALRRVHGKDLQVRVL